MIPTYTLIALIGLPAIFIAIDAWLAMNRREGDTYSEVLRAAGKKWMPLIIMISFGMGLLAGHWWWGADCG